MTNLNVGFPTFYFNIYKELRKYDNYCKEIKKRSESI